MENPILPQFKMMEQYAQLLRRAWLNPSSKPWQEAVHAFERVYQSELDAYQKEWQVKDLDDQSNRYSDYLNRFYQEFRDGK